MSRVKKTGKDTPWTPDKVRERIQTGVVLNKLMNHVLGKNKMSATQINAAKILLAKVLPDTKAVEHSGHTTQTVEHVGVANLRRRLDEFISHGSGMESDRPPVLPN